MSVSPDLQTRYDEVPYPSLPFPTTHPDHLAVVATLLGLSPARADRCRVLELGCASGGNLIPLAYAYPESSFLGVDLSVVQIRQGEELKAALGLGNIELRAMSILDVDDGSGTFDFIICHGVYSWVPEAVRYKILEICDRHLAPQGIAFVSYNTFPGWHMRGMIRSIMQLHERRYRDHPSQERIDQSRAILNFLAEAFPGQNTPYRVLLRAHREDLRESSDGYLFHEYLEECNEPVYFLEFCERLATVGLRYVGDSEFRDMFRTISLTTEVRDRLKAMDLNLLEMEQYLDLLNNRMFRQTLIGHSALRPDYVVRAGRMGAFHVGSPLRPSAPDPDLASDLPEEFTSDNGIILTTPIPIVKMALTFLGEIWPRLVAFNDLLDEARSRLSHPIPANRAADAQALGKALLTAYALAGRHLVWLWLCPPAFSTEVGAQPLASHLARLQATDTDKVTNLRHEQVALTPFDARLLRLLDGTHDREDLVEVLRSSCQESELRLPQGGSTVTDISRVQSFLPEFIDERLRHFAKVSLLLG